MPKKKQAKANNEIRTRGLSILAGILAVSLTKNELLHHEPTAGSDLSVDQEKSDQSESEVNNELDDES